MYLKNLLSSLWIVIYLSVSLGSVELAAAAEKRGKHRKSAYTPIQSSLIIDGSTGRVLHASNAKKQIYPASLTKVATLYLIFEAIEAGRLQLDQKLKVSAHAASAIPLKLGLKAGENISVKDIILAIIVRSANDASRVAAEHIGGSEEKFAKMMTIRARSLGMDHTTFANASGLHDPRQKSTAVDLAKLAIAIKRDFPQYYHLFSRTSFYYNGKEVKGHNRVTANYPGAEGLKTGFTNASGCNLITTATRENKSLIGVVIGGKTSAVRDQKMTTLLDAHFDAHKKEKSLYGATKITKTKISNGAEAIKPKIANRQQGSKKGVTIKNSSRKKLPGNVTKQ